MNICPTCKVNPIEAKSGHCKKCDKEYMKIYYQKYKERIKEQTKKNKLRYNYLGIVFPSQYKKYPFNKEKRLEYIKKINYKYEKTPQQRIIRGIKRKTRYFFPLINQVCSMCGDLATEHHHTTNPIQYDKFIFICSNCHKEITKFTREV
jgi:hypothetical protein